MRALPVRPDILSGVTSGELPNMHRQGLAQAESGDVIVTDCGGDNRISFFGELITTHLQLKGIAAIVTDAGIADVVDVAATELPVFCQGSAPVPAPARQIICDLQCPVSCMGVTIYPGDILVGDENGVVAVPRAIVSDVTAKSAEKEDLEQYLLSQLKQGAPLDGTYPPNAEMLARYKASKSDD
jgi:regulator of RNase E activity RraA